jgi:hypothetical protein
MTDDLKSQVDLCKKHSLEPIVMIRTAEEGLFISYRTSYILLPYINYTLTLSILCSVGLAAIAAGARCMCIHSLEEEELTRVRGLLPSSPEYLYGARLRPEADFSLYAEIDTTWVLRDSDFNFVWPSPEAVYATGMGDIYSSILAMRSKASRLFLSPRQFLMDRKKEGAQEYLGDILY